MRVARTCRGSGRRGSPRGAMSAACPICGRLVPLTLGGLISAHVPEGTQ